MSSLSWDSVSVVSCNKNGHCFILKFALSVWNATMAKMSPGVDLGTRPRVAVELYFSRSTAFNSQGPSLPACAACPWFKMNLVIWAIVKMLKYLPRVIGVSESSTSLEIMDKINNVSLDSKFLKPLKVYTASWWIYLRIHLMNQSRKVRLHSSQEKRTKSIKTFL